MPADTETQLPPQAASPLPVVDPYLQALLSPRGEEVLHAVCQKDQIWRHDNFDVFDIHETARLQFDNLLRRLKAEGGAPYGLIQLVLGEAGSGKTHLLRFFRNHVHYSNDGFCGYLQMTTGTQNYPQYVLSNLIDSLDEIYFEPDGDETGLMRLADAVGQQVELFLPKEIQRLREDDLTHDELAQLTNELADALQSRPGNRTLDAGVIRALLSLIPRHPKVHTRVLKYLRCEPFSSFDEKILPEMPRWTADDAPTHMIAALGKIMRQLTNKTLVILVDQLEEMANFDEDPARLEHRFRHAMQAISSLVGGIPGALCVVGCLADLYHLMEPRLPAPVLARVATDPRSIQLIASRTRHEAKQIIETRLKSVYEQAGLENPETIAPFTEEFIDGLEGLTARDILFACRAFRDRLATGEPVETPPPPPPPAIAWPQEWNDFRARHTPVIPEDAEQQLRLLHWAIEQCTLERQPAAEWSTDLHDDSLLIGATIGGVTRSSKLLAAFCDENPQGGKLQKRIESIVKLAGDQSAALLRNTAFPAVKKGTKIGELLLSLPKDKFKRIIWEDSHWRFLTTLRAFHEQHSIQGQYLEWRTSSRPLNDVKPLVDLLNLDQIPLTPTPPKIKPLPPEPPIPPAAKSPVPPATKTPFEIPLGFTQGLRQTPVVLNSEIFKRHAAFVGGAGSGKTTLALNVIEQLLLAGIPAILIDRKGDLATYASDDWGTPNEPALLKRATILKKQLDIRVYTPGDPTGHNLLLPLIPEGVGQMPDNEREAALEATTASLLKMLGCSENQFREYQPILLTALQVILDTTQGEVTLEWLEEVIGKKDQELVKHHRWTQPTVYLKLARALSDLRITRRLLLSTEGTPLNIPRMLSPTADGRTPLSIISLKSLVDMSAIQFWMSRFLMTLGRHVSATPSATLQAVILLDEADIYVPATSKPSTKEPLLNLLKRARSGGLGVFLATQTPGDLDSTCRSNCATWAIGRLNDNVSINKVKSMFSDTPQLLDRVAQQGQGEFALASDGLTTQFKGDRSAMNTRQLSEQEILTLARANRSVE
ncbi:conserved hypothetical protein [Planctopirus limnophila DSM 3776]|uniref:Helicase HerA central domain-containing protein n=1 Tax=Planctopirus limnophila (strain ATCC 43296 / DSM 3776 / IFAM 1008 / Mu 290) TaxID=521674 RepID=D5SQG8_PLAL2|nr:DUF87 domain-containing protein [Planctopirus limnophila]ADG68430.1 conserved hypothetical protein [Planctopirus limnophila DSM 3776]